MQRPVGFSTGDVHWLDGPLVQKVALIREVGANAIELNLGHGRLAHTRPTPQLRRALEEFLFVSIHAPALSGPDDQQAISRLKLLCEALPVSAVVVHPDAIEDFSHLQEQGLPFAIENMDARRESWTAPGEFRALSEQHEFSYVLDVQHAYEHDPSMRLAQDLLDVMRDRLSHLHVSAQTTDSHHAPLCRADNKQAILGFVKNTAAPIILEGVLPEADVKQVMREELALLR